VIEAEKLLETLAKIAELAGDASKGVSPDGGNGGFDGSPADVPGCSIKSLPKRLLLKAASHAMRINPVNAPMMAPVGAGSEFRIIDPLQIAVMTAKYLGAHPRRLTVSFMESTPADLRTRILGHMNAWTKTGCISFVETGGTGDVRISREGNGYWSYLGTDVLLIPKNRPTMNLQAFSMATPESEYRRVVRHETGHTLGFPHEHMRKELIARIDPKKAYPYFLANQGWDKAMVDAQVLTPLDDATIMGTAPDQTSIMCYQLPASITRDGRPIIGGIEINDTDYKFAGSIYPKPGATPPPRATVGTGGGEDDDWPESDDVA
jgi:hypothetical protein